MLTVACVLKSGGVYNYDHCLGLFAAVRRNLETEHRLVCLTDENLPDTIRLQHDWPGWWAKMQLYNLPGPVLYFDLDTVIVGSLRDIAETVLAMPEDELMCLSDFYRQRPASGILGWSGDVSWIYRLFRDEWAPKAKWTVRRDRVMMHANKRRFNGDQDFLRLLYGDRLLKGQPVQRMVPGQVYSYKRHVVPLQKAKIGHDLPENARVICFHGAPRPWELDPVPEWMERTKVPA